MSTDTGNDLLQILTRLAKLAGRAGLGRPFWALRNRVEFALVRIRHYPRVGVHTVHFLVGTFWYTIGTIVGQIAGSDAWWWGLSAALLWTVVFETFDSFIKFPKPGRWFWSRDSIEDAIQLMGGAIFMYLVPSPWALAWLGVFIAQYIIRRVP